MSIIKDNFMLKGKTAKKLYREVKDLPIIDYHCHLSPKMIAENYQFKNAYDLFLGGDHYKWRQMRTAGIDEEFITGKADDKEKFFAFASIMPYLLGNPLYHWTHLELKRYFNIDKTLCKENAEEIWNKCNELLALPEYSAQGLIKRSNVEIICTTDDPLDTLEYHEKLCNFSTKILPTFRPDKIVNIDKDTFMPYLESANIKSFEEVENFIKEKIAFFHAHGCRLSDHALEYVPFSTSDAKSAFDKKLSGQELSQNEADGYKTYVLKLCANEYVKLNWTMQLHIGALRNNNSKMYKVLGADTGFDSINDLCIAEKLSAFLDYLNASDCLPKTILYVLNPKDNYVIATMLGNFQQGPTAGKIQFGSGWWFNDQRDGMEEQMKALSNLGMLSKFVGMLTDSRSFVSYPRHEYFRRILCNLVGKWVDEGEYDKDMKVLTEIVRDIFYFNAKKYFGF
ncbi:MAG: glucuronate isomerase [Clostridia bacterium]|nr:glucuronate isomerase [Clostridia bacterium]